MKKKTVSLLSLMLVVMLVITACGGGTQQPPQGQPQPTGPQHGGVLRVVLDADPPTIDPHASNTTLTFVVGYHMFEGLYTLDNGLDPIPMLAADFPKYSEDFRTYTISLRPGLKFHNGNSVTADDVVASLNRWGAMASAGRTLFRNIEGVKAVDELTVEITLKEPSGSTLVNLSMPNGGAFIYPKEIVEKYMDKPLEEFVGTGPFEFVEWRPNQHIKLSRFEDYKPVDLPTNGFGGKKVAYVDELHFIPISDEMVRLNGVEGGEYDFADFVPVDEYERLKNSPNIQTLPSVPRAWFGFQFNKRAGVMSDVKIREAFLTALDMEPILLAGYGDSAFWRLDHSIMQKEQVWWSEVGKEKYNQGDIAKAKQLLEEAGYNGEKIVWMSGPLEYNLSLAAKNQLDQAGFNIDLQSLEWATLSERRANPELWDIFSTGFTLRPDPTMFTAMNPNFAGWWENPKLIELMDKLAKETEFSKRYQLMEEVQELFYTDIPTVKIGDYANLRIAANNVHGFENLNEIFFWNVWKSE